MEQSSQVSEHICVFNLLGENKVEVRKGIKRYEVRRQLLACVCCPMKLSPIFKTDLPDMPEQPQPQPQPNSGGFSGLGSMHMNFQGTTDTGETFSQEYYKNFT